MLELLERTRDFMRGKEAKKAQTFDQLVQEAVTGGKKAPTPAQVGETLEATGKTLEDLQKAIDYRRNRSELANQLATAPQLQSELDAINDELQREMVEWERTVRTHQEKVNPLAFRSRELEQKIALARGCAAKLIAGYRGPLRDELAQIEEKRKAIWEQQKNLEASREHHAHWTKPASAFVGGRTLHNPSDDERTGHQRIVDGLDKQLAELRKQSAALDAREREIESEMSKP